MAESTDMDLLKEYATRNSEEAFATLVQRHVNLVYSVAFRKVGDVHKAQDITQAVFIVLARQAKSIRREIILTGWLYQTASFTAASFLRGEMRRQRREQESFMQSTLDDPQAEPSWEKLSPELEEAMSRLGETERNALLLRFFEGKSMLEVASALTVSEDAAKKRVSRAVEKLRGFFQKRGIAISATVLAGVLGANSVQAAPTGLATSVTAAAIKGTAVTVTASGLAASTLKFLAWTKIQAGAALVATAVLAIGTTALVVEETSRTGLGLFLEREKTMHRFMFRGVSAVSPATAAELPAPVFLTCVRCGARLPELRARMPANMVLHKVGGVSVESKTTEDIAALLNGSSGTSITLEFLDARTGEFSRVELTPDQH